MKLMFLSFTAVLLLTGCDHYSKQMAQNEVIMTAPAAGNYSGEYEQSYAAPYQQSAYNNYGRTFSSYLAEEYHNLARYEQNQAYDYKAAALYTHKASLLNEGQMVGPVSLKNVRLPKDVKEELAENRFFLIEMIKDYGTPENRIDFAIAQTRFDCWVDQAQEAPDNPAHQTCKKQFDDALISVFLREENSIDNLIES